MWKVKNRISARPEILMTNLRPIEDLINHDIQVLFNYDLLIHVTHGNRDMDYSPIPILLTSIDLLKGFPIALQR
jgi:hypothetical protein